MTGGAKISAQPLSRPPREQRNGTRSEHRSSERVPRTFRTAPSDCSGKLRSRPNQRGADTMSRPCEKVVPHPKKCPESQNYTPFPRPFPKCGHQVVTLHRIQRLQVLGAPCLPLSSSPPPRSGAPAKSASGDRPIHPPRAVLSSASTYSGAVPHEGSNCGAQGVPRDEKVVSTPKNMSPKIIFVHQL